MQEALTFSEAKYECTSKYANVRLLDSPYHLDTSYDYRIPDSCRTMIKKGSFVILPYGNGNRRLVGVVCGFSDEAGYKESKIKPIDRIASEKLSVGEDMLALAEFIKGRCMCTFGDALKLMLPPGALSNLRESLSITPDGENVSVSDVDPSSAAMLAFIKSKHTVSKDELSIAFPRNCNETAESLIADGYVVRSLDISETRDAYRVSYILAVEKNKAEEILDKLRGDKQKKVLAYVLENGETESSELLENTGAARTTVRSLCDKKILEEKKELIRRDLVFLKDIPKLEKRELILSEEQKGAYNTLESLYLSDRPAAALLHGVTGSGKTSVMLKMIDRVVADGKQAIVLLPEIALTPQTFAIFASRYENIALVHSGLSQTERYDAYMRIKNGEVDVVIGTRSAIFAPLPRLGLVVIDEEHEHTYKSDMSPRYHARDVAKFRCAYTKSLLILASATPDVESYFNAVNNKYTLVELNSRYGDAVLPEVMVVDVKRAGNSSSLCPISKELMHKIKERLDRHEQSIIFINRRGFNNFLVCAECGEVVRCPNCDVSLTYHTAKRDYGRGDLRCHICGHKTDAEIKCSQCGCDRFIKFGYGTQRVEKELSDLFPNSTVIRMDTDSIENDKNSYFEKLGAFRRHEADILLGTSMITKGHDFPDVTLVGVLMADASLHLDDYRAAERTYAMITQVIGRAGRGNKKGIAVIQAMHPDSEIIKVACEQDYKKFYAGEIEIRRVANFPPYCDIVMLEFVSDKENILLEYTLKIGVRLRELKATTYNNIPLVIFGPFEAPVYRAEGKYRMRIIVKCKLNPESRSMFDIILTEHSKLSLPSKPIMTMNIGPTSI